MGKTLAQVIMSFWAGQHGRECLAEPQLER